MSQVTVSAFDLLKLRGSFRDQFDSWDHCILTGDTRAARSARADIVKKAQASLASDASLLPGVYVFLDRRASGMTAVKYIGIAKSVRRPIGRRIVDRLRDDSALDTELDHMSLETAKPRIAARLQVALPRTGQNYLEKHLKVAQLFRSATTVVLVGGLFEPSDIAAAEKSLIGGSTAAGAFLHNRTHLSHRHLLIGPPAQIGRMVIDACASAGLESHSAARWAQCAFAA